MSKIRKLKIEAYNHKINLFVLESEQKRDKNVKLCVRENVSVSVCSTCLSIYNSNGVPSSFSLCFFSDMQKGEDPKDKSWTGITGA
jgi:hypothetical protein